MPDYATIVVATDLSAPSVPAAREAAALAARLGSGLVLVYVVDAKLPPLILSHTTDDEERALLAQHRTRAGAALEEWAHQHLPGSPVETVVRQGVVHQEIVDLARERRAAMIVVGSHGHGFFVHALMGSTAERLVHHADRPVLVVGPQATTP